MDRFIRIVHNIVFISTILILVRVLFVSSFPVNDGYNMAATLYLGKVTWVVVAASLVIAFINRRFYRIGWVDLMVFALVLLLYFNSNSLPLYKEQALLILSLYYAVRLLYQGLPLTTICQQMVKGISSFSLMAVPFFITMGCLMGSGGISEKLIALANACVGWMRGGMAMVTEKNEDYEKFMEALNYVNTKMAKMMAGDWPKM